MKICIIHNEYGKFSGEEAAVARHAELLKAKGHEVVTFMRSSAGLEQSLFGMVRAFFSGIYNPFIRREFKRFLDESKPDVVHVHNVFPLISPSVLLECQRQGIPVVMTLHNFRLVCPNALLSRRGEVCQKCLGGHEWRCVLDNCEGRLFKSIGYVVRTWFARKRRFFLDNVDRYVCLTEFQRRIYINEGFPAERCIVIPNFISVSGVESDASSFNAGISTTDKRQQITDNLAKPFVLYVGRVSPEKDMESLIAAARLLPEIRFKIAGSFWRMPELRAMSPPNVEFLDEVAQPVLAGLYRDALMVVFATRCYEGFPMVLAEAMQYGKAVVCSRIGGLPEIIGDGENGLLYESGNAEDLAAKIKTLSGDSQLCRRLGESGRLRAASLFGVEKHYQMLMEVYSTVLGRRDRTIGIADWNERRVNIGDIAVDALSMQQALSRLGDFVKARIPRYVCFCEGSVLSSTLHDTELVHALNNAGIVLPDGIGTMLLGRIHGHVFSERIQGPRFMLAALEESQAKGYRNFFYGGTPETLERLCVNMRTRFPGLNIAGMYSPPFRELTGEEWQHAKEMIQTARPDLLWIALGSPRQEKWVEKHAEELKVPVLLAVGAAFDFHSGSRPWAPRWIRCIGMEWFFRMATGGPRILARNLFRVMPGVMRILVTDFVKIRIIGLRQH